MTVPIYPLSNGLYVVLEDTPLHTMRIGLSEHDLVVVFRSQKPLGRLRYLEGPGGELIFVFPKLILCLNKLKLVSQQESVHGK